MVLDAIVNKWRTWRFRRQVQAVMEVTSLAAAPIVAYTVDTQVAKADPPAVCHDLDKCREYDTDEHVTVDVVPGKPLPSPDTSGREPLVNLYLLGRVPVTLYENKGTGKWESSRTSLGGGVGLGVDARLVFDPALLVQVEGYYVHDWIKTTITPKGQDGGESGTIEGTRDDIGFKLRLVPGYHGENFAVGLFLEGSASAQFRDFSGSKVNTDTGKGFEEIDKATHYTLDGVIGGYIAFAWGGKPVQRQGYVALYGGWDHRKRFYDETTSSLDGYMVGLRLRHGRVVAELAARLFPKDGIDATYSDDVTVKPTTTLYGIEASVSVEVYRTDPISLWFRIGCKAENHGMQAEDGDPLRKHLDVNCGIGLGGSFK